MVTVVPEQAQDGCKECRVVAPINAQSWETVKGTGWERRWHLGPRFPWTSVACRSRPHLLLLLPVLKPALDLNISARILGLLLEKA